MTFPVVILPSCPEHATCRLGVWISNSSSVGALTDVADVHRCDILFVVRADWKYSLERSLWTLIPSAEVLNTILQRLLSLRSQNLNSSWNIVSANHLINDPNRRTERTNDSGLSR